MCLLKKVEATGLLGKLYIKTPLSKIRAISDILCTNSYINRRFNNIHFSARKQYIKSLYQALYLPKLI